MGASVKMKAKVAYSSVVDCLAKTFHYRGVGWVSEEGGEKWAHSDETCRPRLTSRPDRESRISPLPYSGCDLQEGLNLSKLFCLCLQK